MKFCAKVLAVSLSLSLIALAPGSAPYEAAAQNFVRKGPAPLAPAVKPVSAPLATPNSLDFSPLGDGIPFVDEIGLTGQVSAPAASYEVPAEKLRAEATPRILQMRKQLISWGRETRKIAAARDAAGQSSGWKKFFEGFHRPKGTSDGTLAPAAVSQTANRSGLHSHVGNVSPRFQALPAPRLGGPTAALGIAALALSPTGVGLYVLGGAYMGFFLAAAMGWQIGRKGRRPKESEVDALSGPGFLIDASISVFFGLIGAVVGALGGSILGAHFAAQASTHAALLMLGAPFLLGQIGAASSGPGKKKQEDKEFHQFLQAAKIPAVLAGLTAGALGAFFGYAGGVFAAVVGLSVSVPLAVAGAITFGYLGGVLGGKIGLGRTFRGALLFLALIVLGLLGGGALGFFMGAAVGAAAAAAGSVIGALAGGLGLAWLGVLVGGLAGASYDVWKNPAKYPDLMKELREEPKKTDINALIDPAEPKNRDGSEKINAELRARLEGLKPGEKATVLIILDRVLEFPEEMPKDERIDKILNDYERDSKEILSYLKSIPAQIQEAKVTGAIITSLDKGQAEKLASFPKVKSLLANSNVSL